MSWCRIPLGIVGAMALSATLGCENSPAALDNDYADGVRYGRTNDNGAQLWFPDFPFCGVVDGNGALITVPCTIDVATPGTNSNGTVVVQASGVYNPTGKTVHWGPDNPGYMWKGLFFVRYGLTGPPYPCGVIGLDGVPFQQFTLDWHAVVTPSGQATVTCHYSEKSAWSPPS